ncbi:hypothetical protein EBT23_06790, partial [bacterium]|nr:hypothetical protein [bacterium]
GNANPTLTVSYTGLVAGETAITPAPTVTTSAGLNSLPGTYPITVTGSAHANYEITFENGTLTIRDGDKDNDGVGDSAEVAAGTDPNNPADRPTVLAAGWNHTLFVPVAGETALAWGVNTDGRCGLGYTNSPVTSGVKIKDTNGMDLTGVIAVAAGGSHSLVLQNTGAARKLYAAGTNRNGQLGLPSLAGVVSFTVVTSNIPADIKAVAAGARHSLLLGADGKVYGFGDNGSGQVGLGVSTISIRTNTQLAALSSVTAIAAGAEHSLALDSAGNAYAWGRGNSGQLGYQTLSGTNRPRLVSGLTGVKQLAAGDKHSLFLRTNGDVYACGLNNAGQLGLGTNVFSASIPTKLTFPAGTVITKLVTGLDRAHAIASNGKVYGWGYNFNGELGLGYRSTNSPYSVATPTEVPALFGSKEIAGGAYQTFALDESGTLLASGLNEGGQLGVGSTNAVTGDPAPTKQDGKADQNIIFPNPVGPFVTGTFTNLTAMSLTTNGSASGLVPVFSSSDPAVAIVDSNNMIRFLWWGGTNINSTNSVRTVRITATQPGSTNYNAAVPVVRE